LERRNASSSGEKIRTATVPGQTLERGKGRNRVAASIKEQNCDRQNNKIYRDKMVAYLSLFYGTETKVLNQGKSNPAGPPMIIDGAGRQIQISEKKQGVEIICIEYEDGSTWTQH
jgi:hypothetical protein